MMFKNLLVLAGMGASALSAQSGQSAFLLMRGHDTLGIERFSRQGDSIVDDIRLMSQPRTAYVIRATPSGHVLELQLRAYAADAQPAEAPMAVASVQIHDDSIVANMNGLVQRLPIPAGSEPLINNSWAALELLTQRARQRGGSLTVPVWALAGLTPFTLSIVPVGTDSMVITVAGQEQRAAVDARGRILGAYLPSQGLTIVRSEGPMAAPSMQPADEPLPAGLVERQLTVPGPVPLPARLTLPNGSGPFPAVVLVHGSGAGDRDESVGPLKPFRDIAWGLAARGIAVLRYDKRAHVAPTWGAGTPWTVYDETMQDALSALRLLRGQPGIDAGRTVLLGHSLGGMLAPRIALRDSAVAGIVIMAGATRMPLMDQIDRQLAYMMSVPGSDTAMLRHQREGLAAPAARVRSLTAGDSLNSAPIPGLGGTTAAYWWDLNHYDPAVAMRSVRVPTLVLQGMRDYQVPPEQLDDWLRAVGPHSDITVKRYPALNHMMTAGSGPPSPNDYTTASHVNDQLIDDIAGWVRSLPRHFLPAGGAARR